jgi:AcrR family transcriptional regulator
VETLKAVALHLFAEHGVDAVSVRQIAEAAGQKNHAAVGYHFGSKEDLVHAVVVHGARLIDELRNRLLDEIEAGGGPRSLVDVTRCLVRSSLPDAPPPWSECYNRFVTVLALSNRKLFMDALQGRWNSGYLRCLDHIRGLLPDVAPAEVSQRLVLLGAAMGGVLSSSESQLADLSRPHPTWTDDATLDHAARALAGLLKS